MIEKVSKFHPDKVADRIGGAIVDLAYKKNDNTKIACEILLGHGQAHIMLETSETFDDSEIQTIVDRIAGPGYTLNLSVNKQDPHLAENQKDEVHCGDNGIFKGVPLTWEDAEISRITRAFDDTFPTDGKYILDRKKLIVCQSCASEEQLRKFCTELGYPNAIINPLGEWTGGPEVDTGAINRKLGSDMAQSVTGGGLHGKDGKTKADVCVNIYAFVKAQELNRPIEMSCAIGDSNIDGIPFSEISKFGHEYIMSLGGYEALAEYGLF